MAKKITIAFDPLDAIMGRRPSMSVEAKAVSEQSSTTLISVSRALTLGMALREFLAVNPNAHHAQISAMAAGDQNVTLSKQFCQYLQRHEFDASLVVGTGFVKRLISPCPQLVAKAQEIGLAKVEYTLQHAVVKVHDIVFDLTFLRLGENYEQVNNFMFKQFVNYWREVKDVAHLMSITPEHAKELARPPQGFDRGRAAPAPAARPSILASVSNVVWYTYTGDRPCRLRCEHGRKYWLKPGEAYAVSGPTDSSTTRFLNRAEDPSVTFKMADPRINEIIAASRALVAAPSSAQRPPKKLKISSTECSSDRATSTDPHLLPAAVLKKIAATVCLKLARFPEEKPYDLSKLDVSCYASVARYIRNHMEKMNDLRLDDFILLYSSDISAGTNEVGHACLYSNDSIVRADTFKHPGSGPAVHKVPGQEPIQYYRVTETKIAEFDPYNYKLLYSISLRKFFKDYFIKSPTKRES